MAKYAWAFVYPGRRLGIVSSGQDAVIREFFGFGLGECAHLEPALPRPARLVSAEGYDQGLKDLFAYAGSVEGGAEMNGFVVPGSSMHTWLITPTSLTTTVVDDVSLGEWLRQLIEDDPAWHSVGLH